ncbi:TnsA endonuclease N terminal [Polaromonas sp. OV174]|nr:TnsA endonuclease N terminal [Polaromonas sp. OV174]
MVHSSITGRVHHYLSDGEEGIHLLAEFATDTVDIREQYALLPWEETQEIAKRLGLIHPRIPNTGVPAVMTTDLVVFKRHELGLQIVPIAVKTASELTGEGSDRVHEKLVIEREYWRARGLRRLLMTEDSVPKSKIHNLRFFHPGMNSRVSEQIDLAAFCEMFLQIWTPKAPLIDLLKVISSKFAVSNDVSIKALGCAIWRRELQIDFSHAVDHRRPLKLIVQDAHV